MFLFFFSFPASNIVLMSNKAVLVDFGLAVQMTEDIYIPRDLRGTEVRQCVLSVRVCMLLEQILILFHQVLCAYVCVYQREQHLWATDPGNDFPLTFDTFVFSLSALVQHFFSLPVMYIDVQ